MDEFKPFPKVPRWGGMHVIVTEKIDGTNAQVVINEECTEFRVGSRNRWINPDDDNYGFARWCNENREHILSLGKGQHFGEWYGNGIQRGYALREKRFALFNTYRWSAPEQVERLGKTPIGVVPVLYNGPYSDEAISNALETLSVEGSKVAPGFMDPEGIMIYMPGSRSMFKLTYDNSHKWQQKNGNE